MKKIWTELERQKLIELFPDNYTDEVAKILNRTYKSVCTQAHLIGVKKSEQFKKMELAKQGGEQKSHGVWRHDWQHGITEN